MRSHTLVLALAAASQIESATAALSISGNPSIQGTASSLASNLMDYYKSANAGGLLPSPYYWWETGGMMGSMVDYWHYTGDGQYNDIISQTIVAQAGATADFMGPLTDVSLPFLTTPRCITY